MAIIAEEFDFVVGVSTHARAHTFTAVHASIGALVDTATFPTTSAGMDRAINWIRRRTGGERVILLASRSLLDHQRTANRNALTALLRGTDLGIDARSSLKDTRSPPSRPGGPQPASTP